MATTAQGGIPNQAEGHHSSSRVAVTLVALLVVTAMVFMAWSATTQGPASSPASAGSHEETYDWSASRPGGSMYDSQVPRQSAEDSAALRPGGSVYDSQVPAAAREN